MPGDAGFVTVVAAPEHERGRSRLTTGYKIRAKREQRGMSRPVLAGLVGRSTDWLKKIETGVRPLNSLPLLVALARTLGVEDLSELTGNDFRVPLTAWNGEVHPVVRAIRDAMYEASFPAPSAHGPEALASGGELAERVRRLWLLWHSSQRQRTDVGAALPDMIRLCHASVRMAEGVERRRCVAATADLYRLVQRLLAHICEPELHAMAVERGRAFSEQADSPMALAQAAWSSSVGLCASGHYDAAADLADRGIALLLGTRDTDIPHAHAGTIGALQLEAAAAHGLAGREGDAYRYLDAAAETAARLPSGPWHIASAFSMANVEVLAVIVGVSLHRPADALARADKIRWPNSSSVVRRSRLHLERAQAHADRREFAEAVRCLGASSVVSREAVAVIPWARTLADELADQAPAKQRTEAARVRTLLHTV